MTGVQTCALPISVADPGLTRMGPLCSLQVELAGEGGGGMSAFISEGLPVDLTDSLLSDLDSLSMIKPMTGTEYTQTPCN